MTHYSHYSTYIGGQSAGGSRCVALDRSGRIYVAGGVSDRGFPLKNPLFAEAEGTHGFLTIFDRSGKERQYSTLIPGAGIQSLALDEDGSIVMGGSAVSLDFPVKDSYQPFRGGGVSNTDAFLMKLTPDGSALRFATIMGGGDGEFIGGLVVAPNKAIYAAGQAISSNFPVKNAYQPRSGGSNDGFFLRIADDSVLPVSASPFAVSPGRLTFRFAQGESAPAAVSLAITGLTGQVFAEPSVPWLRVTPAGLGVSGTMAVTANPAGLLPGVHQGTIRLSPTSGTPADIGVIFTILAAAPILTVVDPPLVPIGSDDTVITIRGTGFTNRSAVQIETVPWLLSPVTFVDSSTLRMTLPKSYFSAEYNFGITVSNPDSAISKAVSLSVGRPGPAIAAGGIISAALQIAQDGNLPRQSPQFRAPDKLASHWKGNAFCRISPQSETASWGSWHSVD